MSSSSSTERIKGKKATRVTSSESSSSGSTGKSKKKRTTEAKMFKAIMQQLNNQSMETRKEAEESAKKTQEMFAEQKALQDEIIEKLRMEVALMSGGGSETSGKSSSGDLHLLVKDEFMK